MLRYVTVLNYKVCSAHLLIMLLFTEFSVQCPRIVPDGVVWTDVQTAYRWRDTTSRRDPLLFVYP